LGCPYSRREGIAGRGARPSKGESKPKRAEIFREGIEWEPPSKKGAAHGCQKTCVITLILRGGGNLSLSQDRGGL